MSLHGVLRKKLHCCHRWIWITPTRSSHALFSYFNHRPVYRGIRPLIFSSYVGLRLLSLSTSKFHIFSKWTSFFKSRVEKEDKTKRNDFDDSMKGEQIATAEQMEDSNLNESPGIFKRFRLSTLFDKLPHSSTYYLSTPVSSVLREHTLDESVWEKKLAVHKEILDNSAKFLEQYDKDLDSIIERTTSKSQKRKRVRISKPEDQRMDAESQIVKDIQYPFSCASMEHKQCVHLHSFETTKRTLEHMGIATDELPYYPKVQTMNKEDILLCIKELKREGINVVFSLYLLDHMFTEKNQESLKNNKKRGKKGKSSVMSLKEVRAYQELCNLLQDPNLDIRHLLRQLGEVGQYLDVATLYKKVKKLRDVGATPSDILQNLEVLQGHELFDKKIQLYRRLPRRDNAPFPVPLFRAKTLASFQDQLGLGREVDDIAKLLEVNIADFQACWGYKHMNTRELLYKVQLCLNAGISPKDLFNNLSLIERFPVDKLYTVTYNFRNSGLPVSVFVLQHMSEAHELNGNGSGNNRENYSSTEGNTHHSHVREEEITPAAEHEQDWTGETMGMAQVQPDTAQTGSSQRLKKGMLSSKKRRKAVYSLIKFVLQLDDESVTAMFECHINNDAFDVLDVRKNLDYLLSLNFTHEQIATCPLVLAHQHKDLVAVSREAERLIINHLYSSSSPTASSPPSSLHSHNSTVSELAENVRESERQRDFAVKAAILNNPTLYFNTLQYFLEQNMSFHLASMNSERLNGFLDV